MEEGEISSPYAAENSYNWLEHPRHGSPVDTSGAIHSSSIEWPGDSEAPPDSVHAAEGSQVSSGLPSTSSLRLLVHHSPVIRKQHKLALLDGYPEIQIGRDIASHGSNTPRIRLKEMEVSKLHATIFWDQDRAQWSIVDMGSKHGTFIRSTLVPAPSGSSDTSVDEKGTRLSAPRVASMPRPLHHLDRLTIGGTTFIIHIHENRSPCTACSPQSDEELPLFLHRHAGGGAGSTKKRKLDDPESQPPESTSSRERDPKKALALLKRSLLSSKPPSSPYPGSRAQQYVDRSARRRALYPDHSPATTPTTDGSRFSSPSASAPATPPPLPPSPAPLSSTNIGHRLLMKQGWQPGTALGEPLSERPGLVAPLDPAATVGRAGIGVSARTATLVVAENGAGWRDVGKRRRWDEIRSSDNVQ
ncbi:hypothetical protein C8Q76DRAFT_798789 [Earliella scabrosa]|nr:hypothetical protein C8Q76DRAFT_798789 [Earliella scabrosa]